LKRPSVDEGPAAKKVKREVPPKPALSSLLKKVQSTNDKVASSTDNGIKENKSVLDKPTIAADTEAATEAQGKDGL
jgi:hypothetical protein